VLVKEEPYYDCDPGIMCTMYESVSRDSMFCLQCGNNWMKKIPVDSFTIIYTDTPKEFSYDISPT